MSRAKVEYFSLLIVLHDLISKSKNEESEECERIRDMMDGCWHRMTEQEQQEAREYSQGLYDEQT